MIGRFMAWIAWLAQRLSTHADNVTPSLRKVHAIGVGALGMMIGLAGVIGLLAMVGLSVWSALVLRAPFSAGDFGTGFAAALGALATLVAALAANVVALAKAIAWVPDTTRPADDGGEA